MFVELKAPGKKSTPLQYARQAELRALGNLVYTDVDSFDKVDAIVQELMTL